MKKLFILLVACVLAIGAKAQEASAGANKMVFVVEGSEEMYNTIRVFNRSSQTDFSCRVVYLNEDNSVQSVYGEYFLKGTGDTESHTSFVRRGTRLGIQMASDFDAEVNFTVEYKDFPIYDAIYIYIYDQSSGYDNVF